MCSSDLIEHDLHGRQVGVSTVVAAALYQEVLALEAPRWAPAAIPFDERLWKGIAPAVTVEHQKKLARMEEACRRLAEAGCWERLRGELAPRLRPPESIRGCLQAAGAAWRYGDLGCSRERFLTALLSCAAIRGRFTSIDLAWAAGVLPGAAGRIVERYVA